MRNEPDVGALGVGAGIFLTVATVVAAICVFGWLAAFEGTDPGKVCVVQEGGPFDGRSVKKVRQSGEGLKNIGIWNDQRCFPSTQRNYIISADPRKTGEEQVDVFHTPTKDSVNVGVEGQALFQLNTDPKIVRDFYLKYGVRTFNGKHPYEDDEGWQNFLSIQFRPILDNALREEIGKYNCPQLNAACALVKSGDAGDTSQNIVHIQNAIGETLERDLNETLGAAYFENVRFRLNQIPLPAAVDKAVDEANAAKAQVQTQRYRADAARQEAIAAQRKAAAYKSNPYAGLIEFAKALPEGSQPILNLGGESLGLNVGR